MELSDVVKKVSCEINEFLKSKENQKKYCVFLVQKNPDYDTKLNPNTKEFFIKGFSSDNADKIKEKHSDYCETVLKNIENNSVLIFKKNEKGYTRATCKEVV